VAFIAGLFIDICFFVWRMTVGEALFEMTHKFLLVGPSLI